MTSAVLQVITDADRRGAQVFAEDLAGGLRERNLTMRTVALSPGSAGGVGATVLGPSRWSGRTIRGLRRELRATDVAVAHGSTTLPACAIAGLGLRTPFVYRQISELLFWAATAARRRRVRWALSRADHVVALWSGSADVLQKHFGVPPNRITIIPNGVPPERFDATVGRPECRRRLGLDPDRPTALSIGALVPEKGVGDAVDAIAAIIDAQLVIVGEGPERGRLEAHARQVAPGRVFFTGPLTDVTSAYGAADVVLFPSKGGDSMPAVLIEAGFMRVPAVATAVEAIAEVVEDGVTGTIVPRGEPAEFAQAVCDALEDPARLAEMGNAARERCLSRFAIDVVAAQWEQMLDTVARRGRT